MLAPTKGLDRRRGGAEPGHQRPVTAGTRTFPTSPLQDRFRPALREQLQFLGGFLRKPSRAGSVAPSSPMLAEEMIAPFDFERATTIVELGPGTGAFTKVIVERLGPATRFFALELDAHHVRGLKKRFPQVHFHHDNAARLPDYLSQHRLTSADGIISGLPWSVIPESEQNFILHAILDSLAPDGIFTTFAYVHARWMRGARNFHERLSRHFTEVSTSKIVWRNLPPAVVYRCRKQGFKPAPASTSPGCEAGGIEGSFRR